MPPHAPPFTRLRYSHLRKPITDIYWSGALAVLQSVRITSATINAIYRPDLCRLSKVEGGKLDKRKL